MAITLAEAKVGMADKVDQQVIDEFRRGSFLLDSLTFDDTISPGTGGSTLTYGYIRTKTPSTCAIRKINEEYTPGHAVREKKTAEAVILGGSFEIDRVIAETDGAVDEVNFQIKEKVKAGVNTFHNLVINGSHVASSDEGFVPDAFDGLNKILTGSQTEYTTDIDISTSAFVDSKFNEVLDELDGFISKLDGRPSMLLMNNKMLTKLRACARRAGYYSHTEDAFGKKVETYDGIPMLDAGYFFNGSQTQEVIPCDVSGKTSIYAVVLGLDAFHGISVDGGKMMKTYLPNFDEAGAVKKGEVELIAGCVLKNSNKAGVLRGIKVQSGASVPFALPTDEKTAEPSVNDVPADTSKKK